MVNEFMFLRTSTLNLDLPTTSFQILHRQHYFFAWFFSESLTVKLWKQLSGIHSLTPLHFFYILILILGSCFNAQGCKHTVRCFVTARTWCWMWDFKERCVTVSTPRQRTLKTAKLNKMKNSSRSLYNKLNLCLFQNEFLQVSRYVKLISCSILMSKSSTQEL